MDRFGAYTGSSSTNWGWSSAPAGNTTYVGYAAAADQYGSNQSQYSYGQQPSASSYSAGSYSASASQSQSGSPGYGSNGGSAPSGYGSQPPSSGVGSAAAPAPAYGAGAPPSTGASAAPPVGPPGRGMSPPPGGYGGPPPGEDYKYVPYIVSFSSVPPGGPGPMSGGPGGDYGGPMGGYGGPGGGRGGFQDQCPQISLVETTKELVDSSEKRAAGELQGSLQSLYRLGEGCDVLLKVQGKEFPAHRLILQTRSPVFRVMFTHEMLEKLQNSVTIEDCDSESFPAFLEHLYTGGVRMISGGNVFALYYAADKYGLEALKGACVEFLKRNLSVASFCGTVALSIKHGEGELTELATRFFCDHTLDIVETPEWQIFLAENPTVGNGLYIKLLKTLSRRQSGRFSSPRHVGVGYPIS